MMVTCDNCRGKGTLHDFGHIAKGVCFKCNGSGKIKSCDVKYKWPTPTTQEALKVIESGCDYQFDLFHNKFNISAYDVVKGQQTNEILDLSKYTVSFTTEGKRRIKVTLKEALSLSVKHGLKYGKAWLVGGVEYCYCYL